MESIPLLLSRFSKKEKKQTSLLEKKKVKSAIENLCREYLEDFEDVLVFEVLPNALDNALAVITEPDLSSKYEFFQESETLFDVRLKELDML